MAVEGERYYLDERKTGERKGTSLYHFSQLVLGLWGMTEIFVTP